MGGPWSYLHEWGPTAELTGAGACRPTGAPAGMETYPVAGPAPTTADYILRSSWTRGTEAHRAGLLARASLTPENWLNGYALEYLKSAGKLYLLRYDADTPTILAEAALAWPDGASHDLQLDLVGDQLTASWDGAPTLSATDATYSAPGQAGARWNAVPTVPAQATTLDYFERVDLL